MSIETKMPGGVKGVGSGQWTVDNMDTEIWPCTSVTCTKQSAMTWTVCWEKGGGSGISVLVRAKYGLLR